MNVNWLKTLMSFALVAFWPLVVNHCKWEQLPGLQFLVCCDHVDAAPHQDNDCDTDGCALVENGFYKLEESQVVAVAPLFVANIFHLPWFEDLAQPLAVLSDFCTVASPELPVTWQFTFRTALPPRAPSFAS